MTKKKSKKKNLSEQKLAKISKAKTESKINPFEVHINKQKRQILGQRMKNDKGLPGVSRAKSMKKRKQTLLKEFEVRNKSNAFIDKRIGEKDSSISLDAKMLARYASEKKKQLKGNKFNLNEDEELTHLGQSLSAIERFDDPRSDSEDDEKLDANFVSDAHFGGFLTKKNEDDENKSKTRTEVIDEMILNSKKKKQEQKMEREANQDLTDKLDSQWKEFSSLVTSLKRDVKDEPENKVDDFDVTIRELKFEARGKASDKLKTSEEIALEERQKLEKLEAERQLRMQGLTTEEQAPKHRSVDDIDDGFNFDAEDNSFEINYDMDGQLRCINAGNDSESESNDNLDEEDEKEEENESNEEENESEEEDENDTDENYSDLESESEANEEQTAKIDDQSDKSKSIKMELEKRKTMMKEAMNEIPYIFKVPEELDDLEKLLDAYPSIDNRILVVERIIKSNHPSLNEANMSNLENFFVLLILYLMEKIRTECASSECLILVDRMIPIVYELCQLSPENNGKAILVIILDMQEEFAKNARKLGSNVQFPSFGNLFLLKLLPLLFSASDFHHAVITPSLLFISQLLSSCRIKTLKDTFIGIFLCDVCRQYVIQSKRYIPEVLNTVLHVLKMTEKNLINAKKSYKTSLNAHNIENILHLDSRQEIDDNKIKMKLSELISENSKPSNVHLKVALVRISLLTLIEYVTLYADHLSFSQIFHQFKPICERIESSYPSATVQDLCRKVLSLFNEPKKIDSLVWQKRKPPTIKMLEPRIEENFDGRRKGKAGSKEYVEKQKLLGKVKQEMKGAMREIRKDNQFLARELLDNQLERDEERRLKVKKLFSELANQEGDYQAIKRMKSSAS